MSRLHPNSRVHAALDAAQDALTDARRARYAFAAEHDAALATLDATLDRISVALTEAREEMDVDLLAAGLAAVMDGDGD